MPQFRLPGASDRTVIIGATGSGKTIAGAWILSRQNFEKRPWIAFDFKDEEFWATVGTPPVQDLKLGDMPSKKGLYRMTVFPGDDDRLEEYLWKIWSAGNIGLFIDEVSLVNSKEAFKAILRQGRSKRIPVISCTQRPVDCDREVFSESQYRMIFRVGDRRDLKTVSELCPDADISKALPPRWCYYYDVAQNACFTLRPVPPPDIIAQSLRDKVPYKRYFWG